MEEDDGPDQDQLEPALREDVLFSVRFALSQGFRFRPRKRDHYQLDDFAGWAKSVLEQFDLSGMKVYRKKPKPHRSFPSEVMRPDYGRDDGGDDHG